MTPLINKLTLLIAVGLSLAIGVSSGGKGLCAGIKSIGQPCGQPMGWAKKFANRYMALSREISGEKWAEQEFYDCKITGSVSSRHELFFEINSSGAGIVWQMKQGKQSDTRYFFCDRRCRKEVGWPFKEVQE